MVVLIITLCYLLFQIHHFSSFVLADQLSLFLALPAEEPLQVRRKHVVAAELVSGIIWTPATTSEREREFYTTNEQEERLD
jgi:predicted CDP-diglyceride synthetase/phosphatidate cytidylyltransferase